MDTEPHNIILDHLRQLRDGQRRIENDLQDIKDRLATTEDHVIGLRRDQTSIYEVLSSHNKRFDRLDERLSRIEKRLDLVEA